MSTNGLNRRDFFDEGFIKRLQRLRIMAKSHMVRGAAGRRRSLMLGDGLEFADHRAYSPGDDFRFVDWPYYARMEKLLLRLFHTHSRLDAAIMPDCSASMSLGGKFRYAMRAAAAIAYVALSGMEGVVVAPFAADMVEPLRAGRNRQRAFVVLDYLSSLKCGGKTDIQACVDAFTARFPATGTVFILSDLLDCRDGLAKSLARLKAAGADAVVLHLHDPADSSPEASGPSVVEHSETAGRLPMMVDSALLACYRDRWKKFVADCRAICAAGGASYIPAPTDEPLEDLMLKSMRRAGVLTD